MALLVRVTINAVFGAPAEQMPGGVAPRSHKQETFQIPISPMAPMTPMGVMGAMGLMGRPSKDDAPKHLPPLPAR